MCQVHSLCCGRGDPVAFSAFEGLAGLVAARFRGPARVLRIGHIRPEAVGTWKVNTGLFATVLVAGSCEFAHWMLRYPPCSGVAVPIAA